MEGNPAVAVATRDVQRCGEVPEIIRTVVPVQCVIERGMQTLISKSLA